MSTKWRRIAHFTRWMIELFIIWMFVWPETGLWTGVVLTIMTAGIEFDHLNPRDWARI